MELALFTLHFLNSQERSKANFSFGYEYIVKQPAVNEDKNTYQVQIFDVMTN